MHYTSILGLILLAASPITCHPTNPEARIIARNADGESSPVPETLDQILKRATPVGVQCGTGSAANTYTTAQVKAAYNGGKAQLKKGNQVGIYPEVYGGNDSKVVSALPSECTQQSGRTLYEWPILPGGAKYTGGDPLTDRIVMAQTSLSGGLQQVVYCLTMTHLGTSDNAFLPCPAT